MAAVEQAQKAWDTAWELLNDDKGWKLQKGSDLAHGKFFTRSHDEFGTLHKIEAYLDCSPDLAVGMLFMHTEESRAAVKQWKPNMESMETIEKLADNMDIDYSVVIPSMKVVSKRDFVNVRHWKTQGNAQMIVMQGTTHPSKPPTDAVVRAHQKIAAFLVLPVDGNPNQTHLKWTMNPKFGGNVPQFMAEKSLPGGMMKDLEGMQARAKALQAQ